MVTFADFTPEEREAVDVIVRRFRGLLPVAEQPAPIEIMMDLSAVHSHTPLRLTALSKADDFNLAHDVGGIRRHLDRETGELTGCFVPRYAVPTGAEVL